MRGVCLDSSLSNGRGEIAMERDFSPVRRQKSSLLATGLRSDSPVREISSNFKGNNGAAGHGTAGPRLAKRYRPHSAGVTA